MIAFRLSLTYLQDSCNVDYAAWKDALQTLVGSWVIGLQYLLHKVTI